MSYTSSSSSSSSSSVVSSTSTPPSPTLSTCSSLPDVSDAETIKFMLPDIIAYCPFDLKVNPHYPAASIESDDWFDSFNIHKDAKYTEFHRAKFGLLTAMSYPEASYEHLRNCCDFMSWLFAFDDLTDDGGLRENIQGTRKAADIMMGALHNPKTFKTEFKVGETLRSFWERACDSASEGTQRRFIETTQLYVDAIYQQVVNRRHDEIPDIETFIQLRRDTSAVKLVFALVEYSLHLNLPDACFEEPILRSLEQGANDILTWANDMYSFNVEQSKGDTQNLVIIAMNEMGLDVQGAVDWVGELIRARIDRYVMEKALLPSYGREVDAQLAQYVEGLERWVIGVLHWSFDSERYFGAEHARIKKDLTVTLLPVDTSMLPAGDSLVVEGEEPAADAEEQQDEAEEQPEEDSEDSDESSEVAVVPVPSKAESKLSFPRLLPPQGSTGYNVLTTCSILFPVVVAAGLHYFSLC